LKAYDQDVEILGSIAAGAAHMDVKSVTSRIGLHGFVAGMLSFQPGWLKFLFWVRGYLARLLGLQHDELPQFHSIRPEDLPRHPGGRAGFFTVRRAEEDRFWIAAIADKHLIAHLAVIAHDRAEGYRYHVWTIVHYRHWAGPLYFNLIRPFHHLVVMRMARAGARGWPPTG